MNTPLKLLPSLVLALAAASPVVAQGPAPAPPSTAPSGGQLQMIPMGPAAPGQCVAGTPGCGGQQGDMAGLESALGDLGGPKKVLVQTADGTVYQDSSGKWNVETKDACYMPQKTLQDALALPNIPPALKAAALQAEQAANEKTAQAKKEADQVCSSLNAGDCKKDQGGSFTALAEKPGSGPIEAGAPTDDEGGPTEAGAEEPGSDPGAAGREIGQEIAASLGGGAPAPVGSAPVGSGPGAAPGAAPHDPGYQRDRQDVTSYNAGVAQTIRGGNLNMTSGFVQGQRSIDGMKGVIEDGKKVLSADSAQDQGPGNVQRSGGSNSFGRGGGN